MTENKFNPLVSAIITTHNRSDLLRRAINSVYSQTYNNIEIIVVDDASEDDTAQYCKNQSLKYIRIEKTESKGGNHARNIGILASQGEYIAFCDDDDYWLPTKIEKQVALMESTGAGLVHCPRIVEMVSPDGMTQLHKQSISANRRGDMRTKVLYIIPAITSSILVKRALLLDVGMFDEAIRYWQEYELCIRLAQVTNFDFVEEPLYVYRVNFQDPNRLTNKYHEWKQTVKHIYQKHKKLYRNLNFRENLKRKMMISADAIERTRAAGLKLQFYYNRLYRKVLSIIC